MTSLSTKQKSIKSKILNFIFDLSGNKIITFSTKDDHERFDVASNATIGYDNAHTYLFNEALTKTIVGPGSIIVRQFTGIQHSIRDDGTVIPYKKIYGFYFIDDRLYTIDKYDLRESFMLDNNGEPIDLLPGDLFSEEYDFPENEDFIYTMDNYYQKLKRSTISEDSWDASIGLVDSNNKILENISFINEINGKQIFLMDDINSFIPFVIVEFIEWILTDGSWEYDNASTDFIKIATEHDFKEYFEGTLTYWLRNYIVNADLHSGEFKLKNEGESFEESCYWMLAELYDYDESKFDEDEIAIMINIQEDNHIKIINALHSLDAKALFLQFGDLALENMEVHKSINDIDPDQQDKE